MRINCKNPGLDVRLYGLFHKKDSVFSILTGLIQDVLNLSSMMFVEINIQTSSDEFWLAGSKVLKCSDTEVMISEKKKGVISSANNFTK